MNKVLKNKVIENVKKEYGDIVVGKRVIFSLLNEPSWKNKNRLCIVKSVTDRFITLMRIDETTGKELYPISVNWQDLLTEENIKVFHVID